MTDFATLVMSVDATGLKAGEQALDSLATKGAQAEAKVTSATSNVSKGMNEVGTASDATRNRMRLLGQQLGQVTQQAAAGGNVIGALGMQLGDILPMLGVGGVAGIGLTIAGIIAPMAASMIDLGNNTKKLDDDMGNLKDSTGDLGDALKNARTNMYDLRMQFKDGAEDAQSLNIVMLQIAKIKAMDALQKSLKDINDQFDGLVPLVDRYNSLIQSGAGSYSLTTMQTAIAQGFGLTVDQAQMAADAIKKLGDSGNLRGVVAGGRELSSVLLDVKDKTGQIPPDLLKTASAAAEAAAQALRLNGYAKEADNLMTAIGSHDLSAPIFAANDAATQLLGTLGSIVDRLNAVNRMQALGGASADGRGDGMDEYLRRRSDANGGVQIAERGSDLAKQIDAVLNPKTTKTKKASTKQNRYESALTDITGDTAAMQKSLDLYKTWDGTLDGLNRQIAITAKQQDLLNRAQQAGQKITPELTQQTLAAATAYVDTSNALQKVQDEAAAGQDAMKSLFGSLVGGADDAKSAVISLLEQIAQVQAYKGLMGLLGGSGSTAASFIGSLLSYDGGGYTGDGSRSGGIDGKGGSLAIVHPQETIIDHTKSGSGVSGTNSLSMSASSLTLSDDGKIIATVTAQMANALTSYDKTLPNRIQQISNNPRKR